MLAGDDQIITVQPFIFQAAAYKQRQAATIPAVSGASCSTCTDNRCLFALLQVKISGFPHFRQRQRQRILPGARPNMLPSHLLVELYFHLSITTCSACTRSPCVTMHTTCCVICPNYLNSDPTALVLLITLQFRHQGTGSKEHPGNACCSSLSAFSTRRYLMLRFIFRPRQLYHDLDSSP